MAPLSVVIITFNEEQNILRCIESARPVADEILVVDSYSTDRTKAICLSLGVRFIENKFEGYGQQKNFAVEHAVFDYVLNLDADEFLSEELTGSILQQKQKDFPYNSYTMNRLNCYRGQWIRHGSWYPDKKLRLYDRRKGKWSDKPVHEDVKMQPGISRFHLAGDLKHLAYDTIEEHKVKNEKYSTLSAKELFDHGKRATLINLIINPSWAFLVSFIFRLGFLDGENGFIIAKNIAQLTYLKHVKLLTLQKKHGTLP